MQSSGSDLPFAGSLTYRPAMAMTYCPFCKSDIRDDLKRCPTCTSWLAREHQSTAVTFGTIVGAIIVGQLAAGVVLVILFALLQQVLFL